MLIELADIPTARVVEVDEVDLRLGAGRWGHETLHGAAIAADWAHRRAANPALFNGPFYVLARLRLEERRLEGECLRTDYASYLHWRGSGFGTPGLNAFAMAALVSADGRLLIGEMGPWTANAGLWYPPAGSLDQSDVTDDGRFDVVGNMLRELGEEIGLEIAREAVAPGWSLVCVRGRLAMFKRIDLAEPAATLEPRLRAHLAGEARPELSDIRFIGGLDEVSGLALPPFLPPFLTHLFTR